jgi:hypothetical protein
MARRNKFKQAAADLARAQRAYDDARRNPKDVPSLLLAACWTLKLEREHAKLRAQISSTDELMRPLPPVRSVEDHSLAISTLLDRARRHVA